MSANNILEAAKDYLRRGFSIIPLYSIVNGKCTCGNPSCSKPGKHSTLRSWGAYQRKHPTEKEIEGWFGNGHTRNIGIITGEISGIAVLDFDTPEAVEFKKKHDFPAGPVQKTGRDKGIHVVYRHRDGLRGFQKRDDLPGIDLRAEGGYIVASPSLHVSGRRYEWIEGKGLDDIPLQDLPEVILSKNQSGKKPLKSLYQGVAKGSRNDTLARLTGSWVNDGLTLNECLENALLWNQKNSPPLSQGEIEQTVKSIFEKHHREKITSKSPDSEMQSQKAEDLPYRPVHVALKEITALIEKHILLPDPLLSNLIAFWLLGTYCFDIFSYYGYLSLRSATPRCGKSRLLRLISMFAKGSPKIKSIPSAASLFRSKHHVTILDEIDRLRNQDKETYGEVIAVLNSGFERGGVVERVEKTKEGFIVKEYPVYGPKALAGIEHLADTLSDRAFQIQMIRTPKRLPRLNERRMDKLSKQIQADMEAFVKKYRSDIESTYDSLPDVVPQLEDYDDRLQDIAEPLLVLCLVVDLVLGGANKALLPAFLEALKVVAGRREPFGREKEIGTFIREVSSYMNGSSKVFIPTGELLELCRGHEDLSRIETGRSLSNFLKHFDLCPISNGQQRGYNISKEWLSEWSGRYAN